ncbi:MAG: lactate dehydrogenase [Erysipelotrichaceae bacterium]|nr:lactate dehydrogenase [Erysipelotrichaceae bacterium]MDY6034731.1 NAD(P)-dependent oxidoreductase [Bulleidia sp.]
MSFKVVCYGVRPNEVEFFKKYNKYGYDLKLVEGLTTHENITECEGADAVLMRGNCVGDRQNLEKIKEYGIKYVFTRSVGYNHIDLKAAEELGLMVARVPGYSPNAIAELSLTLGLMLLRHTAAATSATAKGDFIVSPTYFSKEIRNCTVGIIGTGRIGFTEAKLYKGLGAKVLGYDVYENDACREVLDYVSQDELLAQCDIVSLHVPYFPGKNDKMANAEFFSKMKDGAIFLNTARGELQDNQAIIDALKSGKLGGYGTDVFANETAFFFKKFNSAEEIPDESVRELVQMYPKVIVTPHIGSNTDEALANMIEYSMDNFNEVLTTGTTKNIVK